MFVSIIRFLNSIIRINRIQERKGLKRKSENELLAIFLDDYSKFPDLFREFLLQNNYKPEEKITEYIKLLAFFENSGINDIEELKEYAKLNYRWINESNYYRIFKQIMEQDGVDNKTRRIENFTPSQTDIAFLNEINALLKNSANKDEIKKQISTIISSYDKEPVNGLIRGIISDIECHFGIFDNKHLDYRVLKDIDYLAGIKHYTNITETILTQSNFDLPNNLYETYTRWIYVDKSKVEVTKIYTDNLNYILYGAKKNSDYYLSIMFSHSAASWDKTFKVTGEQKAKLVELLKNKLNKPDLDIIVDFYRKRYHDELYK